MVGGEAAMPEEDRAAIEGALRAVAEARGDWIAAGAAFGATGPVGYVRGAVGDKAKLDRALKDLVGLAKLASVKRALSDKGFKVTAKKTALEGVEGEVQRIRIEKIDPDDTKKPAAKGAAKTPSQQRGREPVAPGLSASAAAAAAAADMPVSIDLYYLVREGTFFAAAGYDAKAGFTSVLGAPGTFGSIPPIKTALDSLGSEVSFALVVDPLRIVASRAGKPGSAGPAPLVVGVGKGSGEGSLSGSGGAIWLRLDVAAEAVRELIKHRNALGGN
jgi:hypothetical protein